MFRITFSLCICASFLFLGFLYEWQVFSFSHFVSPVIEKIIVADADQPAFALLYIAESKGFFKEEGLEVSYRKFSLGRDALADVLAGNADLATVYETPFVRKVMEGQKISAISALHASRKNTALLGLKSGGVNSIENLKGKRIAVTKGISSEFFLSSFLLANGLKVSDVIVVYVEPVDYAKVFEEKKVDVIVLFQPFLNAIKKQVGNDGVIFYFEMYRESSLLAGENKVLLEKRSAMQKFVNALVKAEKFYQANREECFQIVLKRFQNIGENDLRAFWDDFEKKLNLDNLLLIMMNREGQWLLDSGVYKGSLPNFRNTIFSEYLDKANYEAVTLY